MTVTFYNGYYNPCSSNLTKKCKTNGKQTKQAIVTNMPIITRSHPSPLCLPSSLAIQSSTPQLGHERRGPAVELGSFRAIIGERVERRSGQILIQLCRFLVVVAVS